jgi:Mg/Co/Ni transporter MgtE
MVLKYNKLNIFEAGKDVKLIPGVNPHISVDAWNEAKKHPIVKMMIEDGSIEVVGEESDKTDVVQELLKMKPAQAVELVKSTVLVDVLEKMKAAEKRKPVLAAIDEQLKELSTIEYRDKK